MKAESCLQLSPVTTDKNYLIKSFKFYLHFWIFGVWFYLFFITHSFRFSISPWFQNFMVSVSGFHGFRISWFQNWMVSEFHGFRILWFQDFMVSEFHGFRIPWFQDFMVSEFHGFRIPWFQNFKVSWIPWFQDFIV